MMMNLFVLTAAQSAQAQTYNSADATIAPRAIDAAVPGVGLNLNDHASGILAGATVALVGRYIAPQRILNDSAYPQAMKTFLLTLPWCSLDTDTIFAPQEI